MTRHVLIIDDSPVDRESIVIALRGDPTIRHTFVEVTKGGAGLEALRDPNQKFDLVVLDYRLPDMNAEQFLSKLGVPDEVPDVPIVLLTGSMTPESVSDIVTRGVQDFFSKSAVSAEMLPRIARNAIHRHKLMRDLVLSERRAEEARVQAEQANRAKSQFLTTISHELRTPLTAILGFTELLQRDLGESLEADRQEMLEMVIQSGKHLAELLNDLIDIAKVEAGTLHFEPQPHNFRKLVDSICNLMSLRAGEKHLRLHSQIEEAVPKRVMIDPIRIRQVLVNLLGNAVKYTNEGSIDIDVGYESVGEVLAVRVTDTGCGIAAELLPNLFEPFVQGQQSEGEQLTGAGLGLAISHRLADMMGGSLSVEQTSPAGTTFALVIPAENCAAHETKDLSATPVWAQEEVPILNLSNKRVLIAEDTRANQVLLTRLLNELGANVDLAINGQDALDRIEESSTGDAYDLVLMDIQMPVMDGLEATRRLRATGFGGPIVAITAAALKGDADRCRTAGCNEVVTKPIDISNLHRRLASAMAGSAPQV